MRKKHKGWILILTGFFIFSLQACSDKSRNNVNFNEAAAESSVSPETESSPRTRGAFQVDDMDAIKVDENFSLEVLMQFMLKTAAIIYILTKRTNYTESSCRGAGAEIPLLQWECPLKRLKNGLTVI